ncbi:hypothetical protein G039_0308620 [Pseudomonas aeruginosa VRFPA01]|nr:hypothetical protein G039_0308620 [Pseudomonas aeruginosa VRFPA01]
MLWFTNTSTIAQRHTALGSKVSNLLIIRFSTLRGSIDVKDNQLIRFFLIENLDRINRITDIPWILKTYGFDKSAILHEQARNYSRL